MTNARERLLQHLLKHIDLSAISQKVCAWFLARELFNQAGLADIAEQFKSISLVDFTGALQELVHAELITFNLNGTLNFNPFPIKAYKQYRVAHYV